MKEDRLFIRESGSSDSSNGFFEQEILDEWERLVPLYPKRRSILIPALLKAQEVRGFIDDLVIKSLADFIGISPNEVKTTASFYTMLYDKPVGKYVIQVCQTLSCELCGSEDIITHLEKRLGIKAGETTKDGIFTLMRVECLAACGMGPIMQIGYEYYERLTKEMVDGILDSLVRNGVKRKQI